MGVLDHVRGRSEREHRVVTAGDDVGDEKNPVAFHAPSASDSDSLSIEARNEKEVQQHPDEITADAQLGVRKAEATAIVWSKKAIYATYAWIWLCYFMLAFHASILNYVSIYAFAKFEQAPAYTTAQVLAQVIGGVVKLPIAKVLNIWGRAEGYLVFVAVYVVGIVILAASENPSAYAAGYVLYYIGYDAIYLILDIFIADSSGLRKRAFSWAFASTPFIITAFTGPLAAQSFLTTSTWHWAIGSFAIIQPFVFVPLALVFKFYQKKAEKMGLFIREKSNRTTIQSIVHYLHEFDIFGAIILCAAFVLVLLPFTLEAVGKAPWDSATFIAMVVIGACLFPVFALWEKFLARKHFVRWELVRERTVLGASLLAAVTNFSFYTWDSQFYNFVTVVYNTDVSDTGYMLQIYNVGSTLWGVIFGVWVYYTKRFKYTCLLFGLPLLILGAGLMIYFRGSDQGIGYVIMCQIFIAFGGGTLVIGQQLAVMAAADRDGVPMTLSILYLTANIGGAIGTSVATPIYASTFQSALADKLPASAKNLVSTLYLGGYPSQKAYAPGTPIRDACDYAWGRVQFYETIAATAVLSLGIPAILIWKNYSVDKKQNKGTVL